jgi:hypothetical protein
MSFKRGHMFLQLAHVQRRVHHRRHVVRGPRERVHQPSEPNLSGSGGFRVAPLSSVWTRSWRRLGKQRLDLLVDLHPDFEQGNHVVHCVPFGYRPRGLIELVDRSPIVFAASATTALLRPLLLFPRVHLL